MFTRWTISQKYWAGFFFITSAMTAIRHVVVPQSQEEFLMYGSLTIIFLILSLAGGWFLGKHLRWKPGSTR
jgi:hypothetical protein